MQAKLQELVPLSNLCDARHESHSKLKHFSCTKLIMIKNFKSSFTLVILGGDLCWTNPFSTYDKIYSFGIEADD